MSLGPLLGACSRTDLAPAPDPLEVCEVVEAPGPGHDEPPTCAQPLADLPEIRAHGLLRIALPPDGSSALLDAGRLRGFELDLIRSFAMRQDVRVDLSVVASHEERIEGLHSGRFDLVGRRGDGSPPDLTAAVPLGEAARLLVRSESQRLHAALDDFAASQQERIERLWHHYHRGSGSRSHPQVSTFDRLFRSQSTPWRWTVLAAVAWQESRFDPQARSAAGALGLMQLLPATAARYGAHDPHDPAQAVQGGSRFLVSLDRRFRAEIEDAEERLPFVLASYNAGPGHVDDARALTSHHGGDSRSWSQVAPWLLALEQRRYHQLPVVEHGYCRGREPVDYVERVLRRRALYDALLPSD